MIEPIETNYKGYRFRSRLEARWAVFFDHCGLQWEYEPEGFELSDGTKYLPDFFLPKIGIGNGIYAEVKHDGGDYSKAEKYGYEKGSRGIIVLTGVPELKYYPTFYQIKENRILFAHFGPTEAFVHQTGKDGIVMGLCFYKKAWWDDSSSHYDRLNWIIANADKDAAIHMDTVCDAVVRARSARFGENL